MKSALHTTKTPSTKEGEQDSPERVKTGRLSAKEHVNAKLRGAAPRFDQTPVLATDSLGAAEGPRPPFGQPGLPLQRKLAVGAVDDPLEHEADRVADRVMRMPATVSTQTEARAPLRLHRKCSCGSSGSGECESCKKEKDALLQRAPNTSAPQVGFAPPIVHDVLHSPGRPLDGPTRTFFEPRLGRDLSAVRTHVGSEASQSARAVNAQAYTVGNKIVFGEGAYSPATAQGRRLLAHELAHVLQQRIGNADFVRRAPGQAQCTGVRIVLPKTIVFEGNSGSVSATVKTALTPSETPYTIQYKPAEGQFVITPGENKVLLEVSLEARPNSEIALYTAYRDSLASKPADLEVFASSASATGSSVDPRHARGYAGEQSMGFGYRQEKGWILVEGPSGAAGHGVTTSGFDGVAYELEADELHVIDNKSLKSGTVRSASALTRNLAKNLDNLIAKVQGMRDMPRRIRILQLLKQMREAVASGKPLPKNTKLIVTGQGGQAKGVGQSLEDLGVEFREPGTSDLPPAEASPDVATPPEATKSTASPEGAAGEGATPLGETPEEVPPSAVEEPGVAGGLAGFALPLVAGFIHQRAVRERIKEQAHKEGYVPRGAPSGEGLLYDLGSWFLDPANDADKAVSMDKRLDFPVWRERLRATANGKRPGDTLKMQWDVGKCAFDFWGNQEVDSKNVTYKKQPDGKWAVESGDSRGTPDLNDIVSTSVSDERIKAYIYNDPCLA